MITNDLDELQRLPEESVAEDRTPCIPAAADRVPTWTTVC
jgi:hypothetical protein